MTAPTAADTNAMAVVPAMPMSSADLGVIPVDFLLDSREDDALKRPPCLIISAPTPAHFGSECTPECSAPFRTCRSPASDTSRPARPAQTPRTADHQCSG